MAYTLATLKASVAAQFGKSDGATPNTVRDTIINDARREVYSANRWNFAKKTATLTWTDQGTYGTAPWPTNYTPEFDLGRLYTTNPSQATDQWPFSEVAIEDIPTYAKNDSGNMVFAVDYENSRFLSNWTTNSPITQATYYQMPADAALDGSADSVAEIATPAAFSAIRLLAIAQYAYGSERDEANYDRFFRRYQTTFAQAQSLDNKSGPLAQVARSDSSVNLGFNSNGHDGL